MEAAIEVALQRGCSGAGHAEGTIRTRSGLCIRLPEVQKREALARGSLG
jgi:hypothetical protein